MTAGSPSERPPAGDRTDGEAPLSELEPGTNVLVAGPPLVGKYDLMLETLARGNDLGEAGIVISTGDDERSVLSDYRRVAGEFRPELVGIVECASEQGDEGAGRDGIRVHRASSPADLTGIGIGTSEMMSEFSGAGVSGVRVGIDSLSTLMLYSEFDRMCRFLHVLSGRITRANGIGLYVVNPGTIDASQYDQLQTLFDGVVELREQDEGREIRTRGLHGVDAEWRPYSPPTG